MTDELKALVERLQADIRAHELTGNGTMKRVQSVRDAIAALEAAHAARIAAEAERDNLSDKLELERALTDGAHRRARAAEAERDQERAERLNREKWRHAAIARAEAAEAREREATALLRECHDYMSHRCRPYPSEKVSAFLAGSPAPRDVVGGLAAYERREAWKDKRDAAFRAQEDRT